MSSNPNPRAVAWCSRCRTWSYTSRKEAKSAARALYRGRHLDPYRCGNLWHLDDMPDELRRGLVDRDGQATA